MQNSFYTVMNAMSISTALFIEFIYYLEMTWKTQINHVLLQLQFQTRPFFFCENSCFHTAIAGHFSILGISRPSGVEYEWTHTACNECLTLRDVHLALVWV